MAVLFLVVEDFTEFGCENDPTAYHGNYTEEVHNSGDDLSPCDAAGLQSDFAGLGDYDPIVLVDHEVERLYPVYDADANFRPRM